MARNQFVALEVNLLRDPKLKGMARALRISCVEALGFLALWRELVLTRGDATGLVRGYSAEEVAEFLEWPGTPSRLLDALAAAGFLARRRRWVAYPQWPETITGYYAARKAADRERHRKEQPAAPENGEAPAPQNGHGETVFPPPAASKDAPKVAGEQGGEARWTWWQENYPKPRAPARTMAILGSLSADDWDLVKFSVGDLAARYHFHAAPRKVPNGLRYLETAWYLDSKKRWLQARAKAAPTATKPALTPEEQLRDERAHAARFVLEQLADAEITPESRKPAIKAAWLERWGGPPPWEDGTPKTRATDQPKGGAN
jgi:hypothetical protein